MLCTRRNRNNIKKAIQNIWNVTCPYMSVMAFLIGFRCQKPLRGLANTSMCICKLACNITYCAWLVRSTLLIPESCIGNCETMYYSLCKFIGCKSDILRRPALSNRILVAYVPLPAEDSANVRALQSVNLHMFI